LHQICLDEDGPVTEVLTLDYYYSCGSFDFLIHRFVVGVIVGLGAGARSAEGAGWAGASSS
ncbi:hypothetical protein, partial [Mesorhizobium sp.]|uniref:hypothetical protein n=1 Tax=Mesorhizobium sp. TaxID=1871066 RepID=UPI00257F54EE